MGQWGGVVCIAQDKRVIHIEFFLIFHVNICCGDSLKAPQQGASLEAPQQGVSNESPNILCFYGEIRKISELFG